MPSNSRREIIDSLNCILIAVSSATSAGALNRANSKFSKICDENTELVNEDEEVGVIVDAIFAGLEAQEARLGSYLSDQEEEE
jgi:hypothetical protein